MVSTSPLEDDPVDNTSKVDGLLVAISDGIRYAQDLSSETPSRELSLVITKLQEAQLWFQTTEVFQNEYSASPTYAEFQQKAEQSIEKEEVVAQI